MEAAMKEANILTDQDKSDLLAHLETSFNIKIPRNKERFGFISFHLYSYDKQDVQEWVFQIRWGRHQIFSEKHVTLDENYLSQLFTVIDSNKYRIMKAAIEFCENQLNDIVLLELGPELNRRLPLLNDYQLKVRKINFQKSKEASQCLTNYGLCISWFDDMGDYQEFLHPIPYNVSTGLFDLSPEKIVSKFQVYQDQVAF
jgi:hypothetical protein